MHKKHIKNSTSATTTSMHVHLARSEHNHRSSHLGHSPPSPALSPTFCSSLASSTIATSPWLRYVRSFSLLFFVCSYRCLSSSFVDGILLSPVRPLLEHVHIQFWWVTLDLYISYMFFVTCVQQILLNLIEFFLAQNYLIMQFGKLHCRSKRGATDKYKYTTQQ